MRKFLLFALTVLICSCGKSSVEISGDYVVIHFKAGTEETKATLNGRSVFWTGEETVNIWYKDASGKAASTIASFDSFSGKTAVLSATIPASANMDEFYAEVNGVSDSNSDRYPWGSNGPRTLVPAEQTAIAGSFDPAAAGMAADVISHSADAAVAGMSITNRVFMFIMSIAIGLGQGFQPVCGMNYGAKRYDRVRASYMFLIKVTTSVMSIFIQAFRNDPEVIAMGRVAMRWQGLFLPLHSVIFGTNMLLQTTGMAKQASLLSSMRQGLYFIPLIWILPLCFGLFGVQIAQGTSDFLTACTSLPFAIQFFRGLKKAD